MKIPWSIYSQFLSFHTCTGTVPVLYKFRQELLWKKSYPTISQALLFGSALP